MTALRNVSLAELQVKCLLYCHHDMDMEFERFLLVIVIALVCFVTFLSFSNLIVSDLHNKLQP